MFNELSESRLAFLTGFVAEQAVHKKTNRTTIIDFNCTRFLPKTLTLIQTSLSMRHVYDNLDAYFWKNGGPTPT